MNTQCVTTGMLGSGPNVGAFSPHMTKYINAIIAIIAIAARTFFTARSYLFIYKNQTQYEHPNHTNPM